MKNPGKKNMSDEEANHYFVKFGLSENSDLETVLKKLGREITRSYKEV